MAQTWSEWLAWGIGFNGVPVNPGVYAVALHTANGLALRYIGKAHGTLGLHSRVSDHYQRVVRFLPLELPPLYVAWWPVDRGADPSRLETFLIRRFNPIGNEASLRWSEPLANVINARRRRRAYRRQEPPEFEYIAQELERRLRLGLDSDGNAVEG